MKIINYIAAASLAVGCVGLVGCKDDSGKTAGQKVGEAVDATTQKASDVGKGVVAAVAPSGADKLEGMRGTMEGVVQNALDAGNFKTMTNYLAEPDKKRLEAEAPKDNPDLDAAIKQFKDAWKAKYNGDVFSAIDKDKVFAGDFVALSGTAQKDGTATIAESHGMPKLELRFVAEGGKWKYDLNDERSTAMVREDLLKAVRDLVAQKDTWPADVGTATRVASHRIFAALAGTAK